jgi:hypothetical protein
VKTVIDFSLFHAYVVLVVGDYADSKKHLPMECFNEDDQYMARCASRLKGGIQEVIIHSKSQAISVIAHEAVHAASFMLDRIGDYADHENDEVFAHIVQYICRKAEEALKTYG